MFPFMIPQPIKMDTKFWANQHCSTFCKGAYSSFYPTNCYPFYSNSRTKSFCVIFNTFSLRNNTRSLNSILLHLFFTWRRRKRCDWRFYFARRQELLLYRCRSLEQRLYLLLPLLSLSQGAKKDFRYQPILYRHYTNSSPIFQNFDNCFTISPYSRHFERIAHGAKFILCRNSVYQHKNAKIII